MNDLRLAFRSLAKSPGFAATAVLTLALGIGANTAIFGVVNALLLKPPVPVAQPEEVVMVGRTNDGQGFDTFSYLDYQDLAGRSRTLAGLAAYAVFPMHLSAGRATERVRGGFVTANLFAVLGITPAAGRFFTAADETGPDAVAVLSHALWVSDFAADPGVVGRSVKLNARPFTVIGVAAPGFHGLDVGAEVDAYLLAAAQPLAAPRFGNMLRERASVWLNLVGRVKPGLSLGAASAEIAGLARQIVEATPDIHRGWGVTLAPGIGFDPDTRRDVRDFMSILLGAVGLVLLIACANVANLSLARATARNRDVAVRASLGATRRRLIRELLAESVWVSLAAGALGLLIAYWSGDLIRSLPVFSQGLATLSISPDRKVVAFALAASLATAVVFGLPPALQASRPDLIAELRSAGSGVVGRSRLRGTLVVIQLAVSLVLLVGAGLLVRTLQQVYAIDPGFATKNVVIGSLDVGLQGYDEARGRLFYDQLLPRLQGLPGVEAASLALNPPLGGGGFDSRVLPVGQLASPEHPGVRTDQNTVTPAYFHVMGIPIVRGRGFGREDAAAGPRVAIVNEAFAERLWPGQDPVGERFSQTWGSPPLEVVGVARDAKYRGVLEERRLTFYRPLSQDYRPAMSLHVRSDVKLASLGPAVISAVHQLDPDLPVYRIQTLAQRLDQSLGQQRLAATLVAGLGTLALLLAALGLYGSLAYTVAQRTREIGIRMALGAQARTVRKLVVGQAMGLVALGAAAGSLGAVAAARVLRGQLYGVSPADPATLAAVGIVLLGVAWLASYLPARRASRVDPMEALRYE